MEQYWRLWGASLGKHWKIVTAVVVVITGVLMVGARQIEFATGQDSYLNPESQIAIDNVKYQESFGGETVILLFTAVDGSGADVADLFEGANLAELERINTELATVEEAYSVVSPLTSLEFSSNLVSGGAGSSALLSAASRDEAGAAARSADISIALARLGAVGEQAIGNPTYNDLLIFGNDGFTLDGSTPVPPADVDRAIRLSLASTFPDQQTAVGGVVLDGNASLDEQTAGTKAVLEILDTASFEDFDLTVTGVPVYLGEINDYLQGGMLTLGLAALAVMAVILAVIFGVRWRLLPLLSVLIGVIWAFSLLGLIGISLSLVTISGLPILIGLGIDFAIQIQNRVDEEAGIDHDLHPIAESVANVAPPLLVATIVGVVAFLALRISKVPMIRDFGVLLAVGIVVLVIVGIVIPATVLGVREYRKPTVDRKPSLVERLVVKLGGLPTTFALPLVALAVALFVGGALAEGQTKIQSDPIKWIDQDSQTVADIDTLEAETGFGTTLGVLVEANNVYDQAVIDLIHDFTIDAEARPEVVSTSSLVNTMAKIIQIDGATVIPPTSDDMVNAAAVMPADVARLLVKPDLTAAQINLRLAPSSLEERAVLVAALSADLDAKIAATDIAAESILRVDLPADQAAIRATPAGLATVGIGLLENLSANRANLTYLALSLAGLFLVLRFRSLPRAILALVPVLLAVGVSSLVVGLSGIELSPLTTVSGPLVIATCAEFSVLILGRYLEERQRGLAPRDASNTAASRTGRAFFTSALTTIGGFAVLIGSALPLLRDFGIVVTLNVAIALLAALVVMPPLSVWADERGWLGTQDAVASTAASVKLAAKFAGPQMYGAVIGAVALAALAIGFYSTADTTTGVTTDVSYQAVALPTTTTTMPPTTTTEASESTTTTEGESEPAGPLIDPSGFSPDRPEGLIEAILFDLLVSQGEAPNVANCAIETLLSRVTTDELLALGVATLEPAAVELINQAGLDCGISQEVIDAAIEQQRGA